MGELKSRRKLTDAESERLITEHTPLVNAIARSLLRKLPPNVEVDDLVQDGFLGLMASIIQTTKARTGGHFQSYISLRVRGAMLDGLRENDPGSRKVRQEMRRVERAIHALGHQLGRSPNEVEVAEALDMSLGGYQQLLLEAHGYTLLSLEDFNDETSPRDFIDWCAQTNSDPLAALERKAVQRSLLIAISDLSLREEEVMRFYYVNNLTMKAIGEQLGVTEGRVSQVHTQAIAKLRSAVVGDDSRQPLLAPRWRLA